MYGYEDAVSITTTDEKENEKTRNKEGIEKTR